MGLVTVLALTSPPGAVESSSDGYAHSLSISASPILSPRDTDFVEVMTSPIFLSPSYRAAPFSTPEPSTAVIFAFAPSSRILYTASEPENESFEKSAIHWRPSAMGSPTNAPSLYMLKNPLSKRATACAFVPAKSSSRIFNCLAELLRHRLGLCRGDYKTVSKFPCFAVAH